MDRRRFLHGAGAAGTALLAGCSGSQNGGEAPTFTRTQTEASTPTSSPTPTPEPVDPGDLNGFVRPEGDPETIPGELVCGADYEFERYAKSLDHIDEPAWGYGTDESAQSVFALRVNERSLERGDAVTITLTNLTTEEQFMGVGSKYYLQVFTEAGWMDIRIHPGDSPVVVYPDSAQGIPPRSDFEWSFELTEDRVFAGHMGEDWLEVCPGLPAGRYRFVYWGLPDIEYSLMVAFDLVE